MNKTKVCDCYTTLQDAQFNLVLLIPCFSKQVATKGTSLWSHVSSSLFKPLCMILVEPTEEMDTQDFVLHAAFESK